MKLCKRIMAFILTAALVVGSSNGFLTVNAAGNADNIEVIMEGGLTATNLVFSGSPTEVTDESKTSLFVKNIEDKDLLNISVTFKITNPGTTNYISLLEISDKTNNSSSATATQSSIAVIVSKTGDVFWEAGSARDGTDWQVSTGVPISDGAFHTLNISVSSNSLKCHMDNAAEKETTSDGNRKTKQFMTAFFGGAATGYTDWRKDINTITIGGLSGGSYFEHTNYANLNGEISALSVSGGVNPVNQTGNGFAAGMFSAGGDKDTWLFGGGVETQGRFSEIGGVRSYIGQFEEYIRWTKSSTNSDNPYDMQRYMINAGKKGQDAVAFAANLNEYIEKVDPKAISYLIGPEDYDKGEEGIEAFEEAISTIIQKALDMRSGEGGGYVVIQLPHAVADADTMSKVSRYAEAATKIYKEVTSDEAKRNRMALVDHLTATDKEEFKTEKLTGDLLNANGHYEIAKQLAETVYGSTSGFPSIDKVWNAEAAPDNYLADVPQAIVSQGDLKVTVPEDLKGTKWQYIVTIRDTKISGTAYQNPFIITDLPEDEPYELVVQCKNGDAVTQLSPVEGVVTENDAAKVPEITDDLPKAIQQKLKEKDSLTWLFMGDSITHGAAWTGGYDGIAQLFEKYLKEDLGRVDDIVVNTAVSGATTGASTSSVGRGTLTHMELRMAKYHPDIVSVMLGTNDNISDNYNTNLQEIIKEIRKVNEDAVIIFRSPTPAKGSTYANKAGGDTGSVARMKAVAEADAEGILFIDQYTDWNEEFKAYTYLRDNKAYYLPDGNVHPGAAGHVRMTTQFIRECGLDTNTKIANLSYQFDYTNEVSKAKPNIEVTNNKDGVIISKAAFQTAYGNGTIGDMTVVLTDADGRTYTKELGLADDTETIYLPQNRRYTVNVTAKLKGAAAKKVSFAEQEILLGEESQNPEDQEAAEDVIEKINAIKITGKIDPATKQKIEEARAAYEELTPSQKLQVSNEMVKLLAEAEDALDRQEADEVKGQIDQLGNISKEEITEEKAEEIRGASAAYKALTEKQKSLISIEVREQLIAAENALIQKEEEEADQQAADKVATQIQEIGDITGNIDSAMKQKIERALEAYNALSEKQRNLISTEVKEQLIAAEEALNQKKEEEKKEADQKAADAVISKIRAIGTVANTSECKQKIDEARAAYNALTNDQRKLVSANVTKLLTDAETKYQELSKQTVVVGNTYEDKNYLYRITSDSTAEAAGLKADTEKTINIPDVVSFGGKTYRVTSIQASVFSKKQATGVVIGKNVEIIGKNAFAGCKKLKKVTIKSTALTEIGSKAFSKCKSLKNITIKSKVLKKAGKNCFKGIHKKAVIKVPSSKYKDYAKRLAKKGQSGTVKIKK